jgi:hypothetical protein
MCGKASEGHCYSTYVPHSCNRLLIRALSVPEKIMTPILGACLYPSQNVLLPLNTGLGP